MLCQKRGKGKINIYARNILKIPTFLKAAPTDFISVSDKIVPDADKAM
jgi:hypothetical protein